MMGLISWLDSRPGFHTLVDRARVRQIADRVLGLLAIEQRLAPGDVIYRHRNIDSFVTADEIFRRRTHHDFVRPKVRTFADLGCNVGYFIAVVTSITGRRDLRGVAVDANPIMAGESRWLVERNGLHGVAVEHAAAGVARDFFVSASSMSSSTRPDALREGRALNCTRTTVATVDIEALWLKHVGQERCHLLKVDIEGSEADFINNGNPFLDRVDDIVLEWHAWATSEATMRGRLESLGFSLCGERRLTPSWGLLYYRRR
jgi:FkbM family methyltransferase